MAVWHVAPLRFAPAFRALGVCEHIWLRYRNFLFTHSASCTFFQLNSRPVARYPGNLDELRHFLLLAWRHHYVTFGGAVQRHLVKVLPFYCSFVNPFRGICYVTLMSHLEALFRDKQRKIYPLVLALSVSFCYGPKGLVYPTKELFWKTERCYKFEQRLCQLESNLRKHSK